MNICFDGLSISRLQGTGFYSYTYSLLNKLFDIYPQPNYHLIWDRDLPIESWKRYDNIIYSKIGMDRKNNDYSVLNEYLTEKKIDIYHSPNNGLSIPDKKICKYVLTVHDLYPMSYRNLTDKKYYEKFKAIFPNALKKADCVIAVSNFIKQQLIEYFKVPDKKIEVVYPTCSNIFKPLSLKTARVKLKKDYEINGKFILHVGSIHQRKNLDVVIKAFKEIAKQYTNIKLVVVGSIKAKRRQYYLRLKNLARRLKIEEHVLFTGSVNFNDMPYFYNCAECTLNISDYDGFPTTAVETIMCGGSAICLTGSSFKEVVGGHAVLIESPEVTTLKKALFNVVEKKKVLKKTKPLYKFDADKSAKKIIHIYESTVYGY